MIEKDLFQALKNVSANVYPMMMPEDAVFPAITYQVIYDGVSQSVSGDVCGRGVRFQVDVYSTSYSEMKSLKDAAIAEIVNLGGGFINSRDIFENEINLYRQIIDFKIEES